MSVSEVKPFQVSAEARPAAIQHLIDESFASRVLPLHKEMFEGTCINYLEVGQHQDYSFDDGSCSAEGIKASKIAEEFAAKQKFSVLDLGCGVGTFLQSLKKRFNNVEVLGISAADFRPTRFNTQGVEVPDSEYVVANLENLNQIPALQGRKFDLIVSSMTFRHLSDPLGVLCQAYELLNENGILIVDQFCLNGIPAEDYLKIFKKAGCNMEAVPVVHITRDEKGQIQFPGDKSKVGEYILSKEFPEQTKIRKVALQHLSLPVYYDVAKSTPATVQDQAHIYYRV